MGQGLDAPPGRFNARVNTQGQAIAGGIDRVDDQIEPPRRTVIGVDATEDLSHQLWTMRELLEQLVFKLEVHVNGELKQTVRFSELVRSAERLLADVSEFMTLGPGDMLMLGTDAGRPRVRAGDRVEIKMPALGTLTNLFVAEAA